MRKIIFAVLVLTAIACNPQKRMQRRCAKCPTTTTQITHDTIRETLTDTTLLFQADTASFFALVKCDSMNHAYLEQIKTLSTQGVKTEFYFLHDTLMIRTTIDSASVYLALKNKYQSHTETKAEVKEKTVYKIPAWVWILMGGGFLICGFIGWQIKKLF